MTETVPGVLDGSMPWYTAFSSSGCSTSGGTSASPGMLFRFQSTVQALAQAQLLELEVLPAQLDLVGERREVAVVAHQHAEQVGHVLQRDSRRAAGRCAPATAPR